MTPVDETHIDDRHGDVTVDAIDLDLELQGGELRAASADVAGMHCGSVTTRSSSPSS
jgi:hypothetical protein